MRSALQTQVVNLLNNMKALGIHIVDVSRATTVADTLIIATGNSHRHVKAIAEHLLQSLKAEMQAPLSIQGAREGLWIVVDLNEIVVHIMLQEIREFYTLEKLWHSPQTSLSQTAYT